MAKKRKKRKKTIPTKNKPKRTLSKYIAVPERINVQGISICGFAAENIAKGEEGAILVRASLTSDEGEFHQYIKNIGKLITHKAKEAGFLISLDSMSGFLLVIHNDGSAELYLNNTRFSIEIMTRRTFKQGQVIYSEEIADVRKVRYQDINLKSSDKIISCFKVGWKFALFFDLADGRDLDIEYAEIEMGNLYRRLRYQELYDALSDQSVVQKLEEAGWFPFLGVIGEKFDSLLAAYRDEFCIEEKENDLIDSFNGGKIDETAERWWRKNTIEKHRVVLEAGLEAYKRGDYVSCIKNIMTEIEGVLADLHLAEKGSLPKTQELLNHAIDKGVKKSPSEESLFFPDGFLKYLSEVTYADFDPLNPASIGVSRHTVGHGRAHGDVYTQKQALQAILTMDQIAFYL